MVSKEFAGVHRTSQGSGGQKFQTLVRGAVSSLLFCWAAFELRAISDLRL